MKIINPIKTISLALACAALAMITTPAHLGAGNPGARRGPALDPSEKHTFAMKGELETAIQVLAPFPSFPPGPFQPILHLLITATGNLSHFGKVAAATTDEAVDLSVNPNVGTAHWVFQNLKGDALWTEMDLGGTPPDASGNTEFHGTLIVIGGSGKFEGATGTLQFQGSATGNSGFVSIEGTVSVTKADGD